MSQSRGDVFQNVVNAIVLIILAFLAGLAGPSFLISYGHYFGAVALSGAVILLLVLLCAAVFGKAIVAKLAKLSVNQIDDLGTPLAVAFRSIIDGRREDAVTEAERLGRLLWAKYVWVSARRFTITGIFGTVAALAGFATTVLLLEQNQLLQSQNEKLDSQNKLFDVEVKLIESQTQLLERQTSLAATSAVAENSVSVRQLFDEIMSTRLEGAKEDKGESLGEPKSLVDAFQFKDRWHLTPGQSARLAFVTANLRPYERTVVGDGSKPRSVERGQVLLALHHLNVELESELGSLNIDSMDMSDSKAIGLELTWFRIENASFSKSDLRLGVFAVCDISNCDFRGADLQMSAICNEVPRRRICSFSNCRSTDFSNADLRFSLLSTTFSECCFSGANLLGAVMPFDVWKTLQRQDGVDASRWSPVAIGDASSLPMQTRNVLHMVSGDDISGMSDWVELHDLKEVPRPDNSRYERFQIPRPPWAANRDYDPSDYYRTFDPSSSPAAAPPADPEPEAAPVAAPPR